MLRKFTLFSSLAQCLSKKEYFIFSTEAPLFRPQNGFAFIRIMITPFPAMTMRHSNSKNDKVQARFSGDILEYSESYKQKTQEVLAAAN